MKPRNFIIFIFLILFFSCKKYEYKKNVLIRINVINVYTDKPFKNCRVFFRATQKKNKFSKTQQLAYNEFLTDEYGNITFLSDIDFNPNIKYFIGIKSINDDRYTLEGFSSEIFKDTLLSIVNLGITPPIFKLVLKLPCPTINYPTDSFQIEFFNRIAEKKNINVETRVKLNYNQLLKVAPTDFTNCKYLNLSDYPSGTWTFETERWKNGQYSKVKDSLFIDYADSASYQIPW